MKLEDIIVKITEMGGQDDDFIRDYYSSEMAFIGKSGPILKLNSGLIVARWQVRIPVTMTNIKWGREIVAEKYLEPIVYIGYTDLPDGYLGGIVIQGSIEEYLREQDELKQSK